MSYVWRMEYSDPYLAHCAICTLYANLVDRSTFGDCHVDEEAPTASIGVANPAYYGKQGLHHGHV